MAGRTPRSGRGRSPAHLRSSSTSAEPDDRGPAAARDRGRHGRRRTPGRRPSSRRCRAAAPQQTSRSEAAARHGRMGGTTGGRRAPWSAPYGSRSTRSARDAGGRCRTAPPRGRADAPRSRAGGASGRRCGAARRPRRRGSTRSRRARTTRPCWRGRRGSRGPSCRARRASRGARRRAAGTTRRSARTGRRRRSARASSSARNAGTWLLLNSAGRCSAICDHTGVEPRAEAGAAKPVVGLLQLLGGLGVPPEHHVGVGAQAADVVDPAGDDVLGRRAWRAARRPRPPRRRGRPSGRTARSRNTDHIV